MNTRAKVKKEPCPRLPYQKPRLKAVDLHADAIMGDCRDAPVCAVPVEPIGSTGPS